MSAGESGPNGGASTARRYAPFLAIIVLQLVLLTLTPGTKTVTTVSQGVGTDEAVPGDTVVAAEGLGDAAGAPAGTEAAAGGTAATSVSSGGGGGGGGTATTGGGGGTARPPAS